MGLNAFMKLGNAPGESRQEGYVGWVELQSWDWGVKAETSWTKGGGASVGKPSPGEMNFEHYYDKASPVILAYISAGKSFDEVEVHMCKSTGNQKREWFFKMLLKDAFLTSVTNKATEEGNVVQECQIVFKEITIEYKPQLDTKTPTGAVIASQTGKLGAPINYKWNIPAGTSSGGGG